VAVRSKPILTPAQLRTLPFGTGVLLERSAPPIMLALDAWTGRPDAATLNADKEQLEERLRAAADIDGDDPGARPATGNGVVGRAGSAPGAVPGVDPLECVAVPASLVAR
jgi:hypothetical protein